MKYLCLACGDEAAWNELPAEEQEDKVARCRVHDEELASDEHVGLYAGLLDGGRIVRILDGERVLSRPPNRQGSARTSTGDSR